MRTQPNHFIGLALALAFVTTGCPSSDDGTDEVGETGTTTDTTDGGTDTATTDATDTTTTDTTDATDTTETGDGDACPTHTPGDGAPDGDPCLAHSECASKLCVLFQDAPPVEGVCEAAPTMCETRFTGRLLDFSSTEAVANVDIKVAAALQAALMPTTATALAMGTSDVNGQIDFVSDAQVSAPLGLVGLVSGGGNYLTATGLAAPADGNFYGPGNSIHDIWAVPSDLLVLYSGVLAADLEFANQLPLGEMGGVVGRVRDAATGEPVAGAKIVSADDTSSAVIRYLNEDGVSFNPDATTVAGVFVLVKPGLGEDFGIEVDGVPVAGESGTAGSANGAIFTLIFNI